ncbi:hypothetical protein [Vibrio phage vB_pir03]|nr:hypothetical protein [Vibrio phage vB_pir03]
MYRYGLTQEESILKHRWWWGCCPSPRILFFM